MVAINPNIPPVRVRTRSFGQLRGVTSPAEPTSTTVGEGVPPPDRHLSITYLSPFALIASRARLRVDKGPRQESLQRSMRRFRCKVAVLIDGQGHIINGHAIVEAAKAIGLAEIPTVTIEGLSEAEIRTFRISINAIEGMATWDDDALKTEVAFVAETDFEILTFTAISSEQIDILLSPSNEGKGKASADDAVPGTLLQTVSRSGDIWCFDKGHRLACGSALNPEVYRKLMGGVRARLVIADPSYNVRIAGHVSGRGGAREFAAASGEMTSALYSVDGAWHLFFMDRRHVEEMMAAGRQVYTEFKNLIVWTKTNAGMRTLWRSQHELLFAWKHGTAAHTDNVDLGRHGRWRSNVWSYPGANSFGRDRDLADHVTPTSIAMIKDVILDVTKRGDTVLDCFCGAGTTLLAAHRSRRTGMGSRSIPSMSTRPYGEWKSGPASPRTTPRPASPSPRPRPSATHPQPSRLGEAAMPRKPLGHGGDKPPEQVGYGQPPVAHKSRMARSAIHGDDAANQSRSSTSSTNPS